MYGVLREECHRLVEYGGSGDPNRSIALQWGGQLRRTRGPKPRLAVDQIAEAAIGIADAEELAALSMRRVAEPLGVSAMALYTYVPSKAELIGDWRAGLERGAHEDWALHLRHPWPLQVATSRPVRGPNLIATYDEHRSHA